jgi:hypothetical protein
VLGIIYAVFDAWFCVEIATDTSPDIGPFVTCSFAAISAIVFIVAAFRIYRCSHRWAWIALITTFVNLASLLTCVSGSFLTDGIRNPGDIVADIVALPLMAALVSLTLLLGALIRELKFVP